MKTNNLNQLYGTEEKILISEIKLFSKMFLLAPAHVEFPKTWCYILIPEI